MAKGYEHSFLFQFFSELPCGYLKDSIESRIFHQVKYSDSTGIHFSSIVYMAVSSELIGDNTFP